METVPIRSNSPQCHVYDQSLSNRLTLSHKCYRFLSCETEVFPFIKLMFHTRIRHKCVTRFKTDSIQVFSTLCKLSLCCSSVIHKILNYPFKRPRYYTIHFIRSQHINLILLLTTVLKHCLLWDPTRPSAGNNSLFKGRSKSPHDQKHQVLQAAFRL